MTAVVRTIRKLDEQPPETLPIVKGIPIPQGHVARGKSLVRATLRRLQVGDSFLASGCQRNKAYPIAKALGMEITVRAAGDGKHRVWRTR